MTAEQRVYIVRVCLEYDGCGIEGVFRQRKDAAAYRRKLLKENQLYRRKGWSVDIKRHEVI